MQHSMNAKRVIFFPKKLVPCSINKIQRASTCKAKIGGKSEICDFVDAPPSGRLGLSQSDRTKRVQTATTQAPYTTTDSTYQAIFFAQHVARVQLHKIPRDGSALPKISVEN